MTGAWQQARTPFDRTCSVEAAAGRPPAAVVAASSTVATHAHPSWTAAALPMRPGRHTARHERPLAQIVRAALQTLTLSVLPAHPSWRKASSVPLRLAHPPPGPLALHILLVRAHAVVHGRTKRKAVSSTCAIECVRACVRVSVRECAQVRMRVCACACVCARVRMCVCLLTRAHSNHNAPYQQHFKHV